MATVYLAHDLSLDREVAVKVLPRQFVQDLTFRERFEREARAIGRLRNEAVVQVYDFGEQDGQPYLVMEYMLGATPADRLANGPLPPDEVVRILTPIASALDSAHAARLIHRDVKPAKILFDGDGKAHLSDFGISRMTGATQSLTQANILGTPAYMSPEQCEGSKDLTSATDVYSLGVVAYEMLTGRLPFVSDSPFVVMRRHIQEIPAPPSAIDGSLGRFDVAVLAPLAKGSLQRHAPWTWLTPFNVP